MKTRNEKRGDWDFNLSPAGHFMFWEYLQAGTIKKNTNFNLAMIISNSKAGLISKLEESWMKTLNTHSLRGRRRKGRGEREQGLGRAERITCYKNTLFFISAPTEGRKIPIG